MEGFEFLARGKRSSIFVGTQDGMKVALKIFDKHVDRAFNEAYWLKRLNKVGIGPKFLAHDRNRVMYEFAEGTAIRDFLKEDNTPLDILKNVLLQCRKMDLEGVNKEEMQNPEKHIIITKDRGPVMIDFEKCRSTKAPQNVTQFCQYLMSFKLRPVLKKCGIKLEKKEFIKLLKNYKDDMSPNNFKSVRMYLKKKEN